MKWIVSRTFISSNSLHYLKLGKLREGECHRRIFEEIILNLGKQKTRYAKRKLDDHYFYGKYLSIRYAPEYETLKETEEKLKDRMRIVNEKVGKCTLIRINLSYFGKNLLYRISYLMIRVCYLHCRFSLEILEFSRILSY